MEPSLVVVGLNYRTSPVAVRERYWMGEAQVQEALEALGHAEGIEEIIVLATCNRTEFLVWAGDPSIASASILGFLYRTYKLKLCDWQHFYRLTDSAALEHIFRVPASLDSMIVGEPEIVAQVKEAWQRAQRAGTTGRYLDAVMQKALTVSKRVRNETAIGSSAVSVPYAAVELARQRFGDDLRGKKVLVIGAGRMGELSVRYLRKCGITEIRALSRTFEHAQEIARKLGGLAVRFEELTRQLAEADLVISSTGCPRFLVTRKEAEAALRERGSRPLFLIDIAVPRDIAPEVGELPGIELHDIDDLNNKIAHNRKERNAAAEQAERIIRQEEQDFRPHLEAQRVVPVIVALRQRLEEICEEEVERYGRDYGPLEENSQHVVQVLSARVVQRLANTLARELKTQEGEQQQELAHAVERLFHLQRADAELVPH